MGTIGGIWSEVKRRVTREIPLDYQFGPGGRLAYELVLDSSLSMAVTDFFPWRLTAARQAAKGFVNRCADQTPDALVGVVFYSDSAHVASDLVPVRKCLKELHWAVDSRGIYNASNISAGLTKAGSEFAAKGRDLSPVIVLLTTGPSHLWTNPVKIASKLRAAGIQIDIIGIGGSPTGVNEYKLKRMASVVNGQLRYWFIRDTLTLVHKCETLALGKV
ncbi:MAG: vWA domain-containing protein [Limisphaerales bacterium]